MIARAEALLDSGRGLSTVLALGVVVVAILGYAIGSSAGGGSPVHVRASGAQLAASNVLLEAPTDWSAAASAPAIPGLQLAGRVAFAPGGNGASTGLITGSIASDGPTPLPAAFISDLAAVPRTAVVALSQVEAFRYTAVRVRGLDQVLTLFAVPVPGGQTSVLACYAPVGQAAALSTCEAVVATLHPVGQASSTSLAPNGAYAGRLSEMVHTLEGRRVATRAEMTGAGPKRAPAGELASAFAAAVASLDQLEPPIAIAQAQVALARALAAGRDAYRALAAAETPAAYEAARERVSASEAAVTRALESFTLLGYGG